ncbi:transcription factor HES-2-like [Corythoichthys intestinalis]|uniref:transcription factor HES-2-like n=1 Tax=Corythoichthys intestinalis TaxID=161448 RepID=UPI0025A60B93|nr:transcription factor HES-2-like [Corythoichthys intestinalis]XP_057690714.1 transcription factor HES-2-like [Corythoichthys intestinalis]XP_061789231.1 transcription factor HES-2-like [Nerophis lumbriciformis]
MKMLQPCQHANTQRKSLKPEVERRRRERINRSLENLKTLLIAAHVNGGRRLEKAEILEQTVLFLQQHAKNKKQQLHFYQNDISSRLQRAANFLQTESKGFSSSSSSTSSSSSWPSGSPLALGGPSRTSHKKPNTAGSLWRPWS